MLAAALLNEIAVSDTDEYISEVPSSYIKVCGCSRDVNKIRIFYCLVAASDLVFSPASP